jgi:hypothetical protein
MVLSGWYFSKYIRTVAPLPAVPDKRKITREPSVNRYLSRGRREKEMIRI